MFSEYSDLITQLKTTDAHFSSVCERHDALDQQIARMEEFKEPATHLQIEQLKKEKLALKDEVYAALRKALPA